MTGTIGEILRSEFGGWHPRLHLFQGLAALLPSESFIRLRPRLFRLAGIRIGRGTCMSGRVRLVGCGDIARRLVVGSDCYLNENITFSLGAMVILEDNVSVGMECLIVTSSHEMGTADFRAGGRGEEAGTNRSRRMAWSTCNAAAGCRRGCRGRLLRQGPWWPETYRRILLSEAFTARIIRTLPASSPMCRPSGGNRP